MFDKLKQLRELKALQDQMKSERYEVSGNGVKVVVNGNLVIESLEFTNPDEGVSADGVKQTINDAFKKAQQGMAQKLQGMNLGL